MSTLSSRVAAEIRAELARRQMTAGDLIDQVYGVSPATMRRKISGQYMFDLDEIKRIAAALDIPVPELMQRAEAQEAVA